MPAERVCLDTNVLIYAFSSCEKTQQAKEIIASADVLSVQALNEFTHVAYRKLGMSWGEITESLDLIRKLCPNVVPIGIDIHEHGLALADRFKLSFFDALMIAAALSAECDLLYSEDMQHGLLIDGRLRITNPFHA